MIALCRNAIAGKDSEVVRIVHSPDIPRGETGKVKRHELEKML